MEINSNKIKTGVKMFNYDYKNYANFFHPDKNLLYQDKLELMKYLYSLERIEKETFVWYLKEYFLRNTIVTKTMNSVILYNFNKRMIMLLNKNNI